MGELHLEVACSRLSSDFKVPVKTGMVRIAYRETLPPTVLPLHVQGFSYERSYRAGGEDGGDGDGSGSGGGGGGGKPVKRLHAKLSVRITATPPASSSSSTASTSNSKNKTNNAGSSSSSNNAKSEEKKEAARKVLEAEAKASEASELELRCSEGKFPMALATVSVSDGARADMAAQVSLCLFLLIEKSIAWISKRMLC
jgi:hypothetical protein